MTESPITSGQCRAARALVGWGQRDLETKSGVAKKTITDFEGGKRRPRKDTLADIRKALERAGIIFIDGNGEGPGVRLSKSKTKR